MDLLHAVILIIFLRQSCSLRRRSVICTLSSGGNKIDCSKRNLTTIPIYFKVVTNTNITEIDLSYNIIRTIKWNYFRGFPNLQVLRLTGNRLNRTNGNVFRYLSRLRELYLDHNNFHHIPTRLFANLSNLTKLYLDENRIGHIEGYAFRGLSRLKGLRLRHNDINKISDNSFKGLEATLRHLNLKNNCLDAIPTGAIKSMKQLVFLELSSNNIKVVEADSFAGLSSLREFRIFPRPAITKTESRHIIKINENAFRGMMSLQKLNLDSPYVSLSVFPGLEGTDNIGELGLMNMHNLIIPPSFCLKKQRLNIIRIRNSTIDTFPTLSKCTSLRKIELMKNKIRYISKMAFSGLKYITAFDTLLQKNTVEVIDQNAFSNLPSLKELDLSHYFLNAFPNFNGTTNLQKLKLQFCNITDLPHNLCRYLPNLEHLDLSQNTITTLPDFSQCKMLKLLDLFQNQIKAIGNELTNLKKLEILTLSDNHLTVIGNQTFVGCPHITNLYLDWNMIHTIEDYAFRDIQNLEVLNVSHNKLKKLPSQGLRSLVVIDAVKNKDLLTFPTREGLPFARQLRLTYRYHCCCFMEHMRSLQNIVRTQKLSANSTWVIESRGDYRQIFSTFNATREREIEPHNMEPLLRKLNENATKLFFYPERKHINDSKVKVRRFIREAPYCEPEPNDFYPCEDLMGKEWLRICVWLVVFLAVLGNIFVLIVLTVNYAKLDVPRYLIINLAFADLCLGTYLGFLAFVDLVTLGDFRSYGLEWQFSVSCKTAGFLAVFASELSVYTLSTITIERFTTIKNSMHIEKRMTKKQAVVIMAAGWFFSAVVAALPLYSQGSVKFSDYSTYSICLPFDIETFTSKVYVSFVLIFNLLAFIVILCCYIKIYLFIRGSHAWNSGDARIARRMAILVFTDFLCWFPIALVALSAVFENSLIKSLWVSKILTIFIFPLNACANPFLYAILTKQFRKDIMLFVRHVKGKSIQREIRKSFLKTQFKNSLTYSTSVRRGSSFSFLFGRRCSSKQDEIKLNARIIPVQEPVPSNELEKMSIDGDLLDAKLAADEGIFEQEQTERDCFLDNESLSNKFENEQGSDSVEDDFNNGEHSDECLWEEERYVTGEDKSNLVTQPEPVVTSEQITIL